ncbi:MAG TPA: tetratricopeptide repeat protein, partial [Candidatus Eisenbacteria bacterium]|nr:tetratricopeptide repeat protein [Candidatus Eisenbacteria bacterium]
LLVTSRNHFTLPGLVARNLDELPHEDACELLLKIEPRIGDAADRIARLCDRLPIALRLAAGALAERPDLTPDSYLHQLVDEKKRLGLIEGTLKLSVQLLSEELQGLWCRLVVFPDSFDADAAAAVWGLEPALVLDSLGMLVRSSLVDGKDGRYRLHDLIRLFADSHLDDAGRNESRVRHAEYYLQVLSTADNLYLKDRESVLAGLRLFDSEWTNIQAGHRWASSYAGSERRANEIARDFADSGVYILSFRQNPRERIDWLQAGLNSCRGLEDRRGEGKALGNMGLAYAALGEPRRAIELYEQALVIDREIDDRRGEGIDLGNMGLAYAALGEFKHAIELYEQRLAIARDIGDRRGEGNALGSMGIVYRNLGEFKHAIELYEQWLAIARDIGDRRGEGKALCNMGNAYADLGEPRRAIELYEQQLAIARDIGDRLGEASTSWNLGLALESQDELAHAAEQMQPWVEYLKEIGHPNTEAHEARVQQIRDRLAANEFPPD